MRTGILPLGRATFDTEFAAEKLGAMLARLDSTGADLVGPRELLLDPQGTRGAIQALRSEGVDRLLILQVTFTDAAMTVEAARALDVPVSIWAVPEPRAGGRLRLNSLCGLNLASHALGLEGRELTWLYAEPEIAAGVDISSLLNGSSRVRRPEAAPSNADRTAGDAIVAAVKGRRIGRIGAHPDGFHTCAYDPARLFALAGVEVDEIELDELFDAARAAPDGEIAALRTQSEALLDDLDEVDQDELDRSLRLRAGLGWLGQRNGLDAFAIRCWPETFTEYGGAVCGPVAMLGEDRIPCACEADVYGALTQMILQEAARAPVFLADLVDVNYADDSAVIWHCGQAPASMCDESVRPTATIHTNRRMPLLHQFPLKPGRVTLMRISQALGEPRLVMAGGEMLDRPMAFTGTSGVLRFDRPARDVLNDVIASALEHHMAVAYGEHRPLLRSVAAAMSLPVVEF